MITDNLFFTITTGAFWMIIVCSTHLDTMILVYLLKEVSFYLLYVVTLDEFSYISFYCYISVSLNDNVLRINHNLKITTHNLCDYTSVWVYLFKCSRHMLTKQPFCAGTVINFCDMTGLRLKYMIVRVDTRDIRFCIRLNSFRYRFFPIFSYLRNCFIRDTFKIWFGCKRNTSRNTFVNISISRVAVISLFPTINK